MYKNLKMKSLPDEIWKNILGYENLYEISNYGRIKNKNKICKQNFNDGYLIIGLTKDKKRKTFRVHRLVALSFNFVYNFYELDVNHINGIKTDNRNINLEWLSHKENSRKTFTSGNKVKKLTIDMVVEIKLLLKNKELKQKEIAKKFNICESIISDIKLKRKWINI